MRGVGPDQPITSSPHALSAEIARRALISDGVSSGSITAGMLSPAVRADINSSVGVSRLDSSFIQHLAPVLAPKLSNTFPDLVAKRGSSILLEAPVLSGEFLQYQWKRDGQNITGANGATLQISNDDDHEYSVVVSNVFGSLERTKNVRYARGGMSVVSGWEHTLFIDENGSLWGMGSNLNSRLGVGNHDVFQPSPVKIIDENVTAVASGDGQSLIVKKDGSLWGMGHDVDGRLGNGSDLTGKFYFPGQIIDGNVSSVSANLGNSYFLKTDGSLWGMGRNQFGQLGDTNTSNQHSPSRSRPRCGSGFSRHEFVLFIKGDGSLGELVAIIRLNWAILHQDRNQTFRIVESGVQRLPRVSPFSFLKQDGSLWGMGENGEVNWVLVIQMIGYLQWNYRGEVVDVQAKVITLTFLRPMALSGEWDITMKVS